MRQAKLFTKTFHQAPADEPTANAQLLARAGFVDKLMAGCYSYLPLGLRVLRKVEQIVREEMDAVGGQEILMPALHPSENWKITGGWDAIDILFKIKSRTGKDYALGQSEEEVVTPLCKKFIQSYRDLPVLVYQIQDKYRDELRAKSGLLRGREFGMKDLYSFHADEEDFQRFYQIMKKAYLRVFERCGLEAKVTEASGGSFTEKISYEFMVLTEAGEDGILYCDQCDYCINLDIASASAGDSCSHCSGVLRQAQASEAGNVFDLGQKYARDFDLKFTAEDGTQHYPVMGCYGIGTTRLVGIIVEKCHDERGIVWPPSVAPFQAHLVGLDLDQTQVKTEAEAVYQELKDQGVEVLFDDREEVSAGEKFAEADLIGIPIRAVVSAKSIQAGGVEVQLRKVEEEGPSAAEAVVGRRELYNRVAESFSTPFLTKL